jgi:hypothetical protein
MPWTLFRLFMFSLSLSTGLQPELVPVSPYTLVVANINALFAQLLFVFLSGAGMKLYPVCALLTMTIIMPLI